MAGPKSLRGALGHFFTPDEAMAAAHKLRASRYTHFDFLTPFPIHGLETAMGQKRSWLPWLTLALALFGIALAQGFINYVMIFDWPMNYGGKPANAWPSFLPVTFESMVFYGAIGSAIVAIIAGKRDTVPQPPPMLIETGATKDRFVVWISATDPHFDDAEVLAFLRAIDAAEPRLVDATGGKQKGGAGGAGVAAALALLLLLPLGACEPGIRAREKPHYEFNFLDMADQPKIKPQRRDLWGSWPHAAQAPPEGALAVDEHPYPLRQEQVAEATARGRNPLPATAAVLARGEWVYTHACVACHGKTGAGDGEVAKLFPKPPHLARQVPRDYTDARLFHVPMRGQGSMPSHARQFEDEELWSVVHHLRALQASQAVAPPDAKDLEGKGAQP